MCEPSHHSRQTGSLWEAGKLGPLSVLCATTTNWDSWEEIGQGVCAIFWFGKCCGENYCFLGWFLGCDVHVSESNSMKALKGSNKDSARPSLKAGDEEWVYLENTEVDDSVQSTKLHTNLFFARKWQIEMQHQKHNQNYTKEAPNRVPYKRATLVECRMYWHGRISNCSESNGLEKLEYRGMRAGLFLLWTKMDHHN